MAAVDRGEVLGGVGAVARGVRDPVLAADDGRDALAQQGELHVGVEQRAVGVRVRVDEAGHEQPAAAVDEVSVAGVDGARRRDASDALAVDEHIGCLGADAVGIDDDHVSDEDRHRGS
ncbi:hypothetical protein JOE59_000564 [Agromyces cerinus]|uniref:hypothetical protein n=1 Tax=Agromyces cerinus TaxID=33878 RepID=UPI0035ABFDFA|nr:hypothetical protein [Agromyces cerinus]